MSFAQETNLKCQPDLYAFSKIRVLVTQNTITTKSLKLVQKKKILFLHGFTHEVKKTKTVKDSKYWISVVYFLKNCWEEFPSVGYLRSFRSDTKYLASTKVWWNEAKVVLPSWCEPSTPEMYSYKPDLVNPLFLKCICFVIYTSLSLIQ